MLPNLSKESGCKLHYTNHSLRATGITRLFNSGVPEKVIAERSGHRSLNVLFLGVYLGPGLDQELSDREVLGK